MTRLMGWLFAAIIVALPGPTVSVTPSDVPAGEPVTFSGSGFGCDAPVAVTVQEYLLDQVYPSGGSISGHGVVPLGLRPGNYRLTATCLDGSGSTSTPLRVEPAASTATPRIVLAPATAAPGATVTVTGSGFDNCVRTGGTHDGRPAPVEAVVSIGSTVLAHVPVSEGTGAGGFHTSITVPPDLDGAHPVTATCNNREVYGTTSATATLTVGTTRTTSTPGPTPGGTPGGIGDGGGISGTEAVVAGLAVLLAVVGIGTVAVRRRRPAPPHRPAPPPPAGTGPDVRARVSAMRSGPVVVRTTGAGQDVAIRVVLRSVS